MKRARPLCWRSGAALEADAMQVPQYIMHRGAGEAYMGQRGAGIPRMHAHLPLGSAQAVSAHAPLSGESVAGMLSSRSSLSPTPC